MIKAELIQHMGNDLTIVNSARAYKLRISSDSQKEIQALAKQWNDVIGPLYPESWKALTK